MNDSPEFWIGDDSTNKAFRIVKDDGEYKVYIRNGSFHIRSNVDSSSGEQGVDDMLNSNADWSDLGSVPSYLGAGSGTQMYVDSNILGFHASGGWSVVIAINDSKGKLWLGPPWNPDVSTDPKDGVTGNYFYWDGDDLHIQGTIAVTSTSTFPDGTLFSDVHSTLYNIGDDEKLTPSEKLVAKTTWDGIALEYVSLAAQADAMSVSRTDYGSKYNALNAYLNSDPGVISNLTTTTDITRATWNTRWSQYYEEKQKLSDALIGHANTTADNVTNNVNTNAFLLNENQTLTNQLLIGEGHISVGNTEGSYISSAGKDHTNYDDTEGFYLGHDGGSSFDFHVGSGTSLMHWDGSLQK